MKLALLNIVVSLCLYQCMANSCPLGFVKLETGCYYFSNNKTTWFEAMQKCANMDSSLLSIETVEESIAIKLHLFYNQPNNAFYWMSGSDAQQEGKFKWMTTLKEFNYTDWCYTEPNNYANLHHCALLVHYKNNAVCWGDFTCYLDIGDNKIPIFYVCELNPSVPCEC